MRHSTFILALLSARLLTAQSSYSISTAAGTATIQNGIPASQAFLRYPGAVQVDPKGNIYIVDTNDFRVRRIDTKGIITTIAGSGISGFSFDGGPALQASLNFPLDIAVDRKGLFLYIADTNNHRVRKVDLTTGVITTIAGTGSATFSGDGGPASKAGIQVDSLTVDDSGNVYVSSSRSHRIRKIDAVTGIITTFAGNGTSGWSGDSGAANTAQISYPWSVTTDKQFLYIADLGNNLVRRVDLSSKFITTYAGTGYRTCPVRDSSGYCASSGDGGELLKAGFAGPAYVSTDAAGNLLIMDNNSLRSIPAGSPIITHVAGLATAGYSGDGDGSLSNVQFYSPYGVAIAGANDFLVADSGNFRVRRVRNNAIQTIAGFSSPDGHTATSTYFNYPISAAVTTTGDLVVSDSQNHRIRKAAAGTNLVSTIAGTGYDSNANGGLPSPWGSAAGPNGSVFFGNSDHIIRIDSNGTKTVAGVVGSAGFSGDGSFASNAKVNGVAGLRVDPQGNVYFADTGNRRVRRIDATSGIISTVAGNGSTSTAGENVPATSVGIVPYDVALDSGGNLYITDAGIPRIRKVAASSGLISTVAGGTIGNGGDGGPATKAGFLFPSSVTVDAANNIFIADPSDYTIRRVDSKTGIITRIAGTADLTHYQESGAALTTSLGATQILALADGSLLAADASNDRIRKLTPQIAKSLSISQGDKQAGAPGGLLSISAKVADAAGFPVAFVPVTFTVTSGTAQPAPATISTAADGTATTQLTLGDSLGPITVRADSTGLSPVTFNLAIVPPFINPQSGITGLPGSNPPVSILTPNGLMQIAGQGFLPSGTTGGKVGDGDLVNGALPTTFNGVCVTVGGTPAPLLAVTSSQVIFQVPGVNPGDSADVVLTLACGTGADSTLAAVTLPVQAVAPEFFYTTHNADGTNVIGAASAGDGVVAFATGLGVTNPAANPGDIVTAQNPVAATVTLQLGAQPITPDSVTSTSGLPGAPYITTILENAGLYQVSFTIPADAPSGLLPLIATTDDGSTSPTGTYIFVRPASSSAPSVSNLISKGRLLEPVPDAVRNQCEFESTQPHGPQTAKAVPSSVTCR